MNIPYHHMPWRRRKGAVIKEMPEYITGEEIRHELEENHIMVVKFTRMIRITSHKGPSYGNDYGIAEESYC